MTIDAKIIADSISPEGKRLLTFQTRHPRFIHAEELTHRILSTSAEAIVYEAIADGFMYDRELSRNASSSRAIPVSRMIEDIRRDPAMPIYWGSHQPGMQAGAELTGKDLAEAKRIWLDAMGLMIMQVEQLMELGLHKQIANRLLEPWAHINVVVTATEWSNFYTLRRHKDAQPEIKLLADLMWGAAAVSTPTLLGPGSWHLPYVTAEDREEAYKHSHAGTDSTSNPHTTDALYEEYLIKVSVARCARVSYLTFDGRVTSFEEDVALFQKLMGGQPLHASPAEHQATPDTELDVVVDGHPTIRWAHAHQHGNLVGWRQYRKTLAGEFVPG